jgi:hypothetical protein
VVSLYDEATKNEPDKLGPEEKKSPELTTKTEGLEASK